MNSVLRPAKSRVYAASGAHEVVIVIAVGVTLGLAAFFTEGYMSSVNHDVAVREAKANATAAVTAAAAGKSDEEIYTGSILYMPNDGKRCRQLLFDNLNGTFSDNGYVDCERAAYNGLDGPKRWSAARIRVIATGFRGD